MNISQNSNKANTNSNDNSRFNNYNTKFNEKIKNLYSNAYEGKIFKGKIITFKQNKISYKEKINYDIFFTKNLNENFCSLSNNKSSSFIRSKNIIIILKYNKIK
jgi:hypothetical protein